jgi:hypothetical protein
VTARHTPRRAAPRADGGAATPRIGEFVPRLTDVIVLVTLLAIPLRIIRYGYLPILDDPVADAAKAVSGRPWTDILILRDYYRLDPHVGWHALLRQVWLITSSTPEALVRFSVVGLFLIVALSALPWLKRPESWLVALIIVAGVGANFMGRFMMGRPFLVSVAVLVTILFLWNARRERSPDPDWRIGLALAALIAVAVLLHGTWYLWSLPVAAFLFAGEFRWARALTIAWVVGTIVAALITGHPFEYPVEAVRMAIDAFDHATQRTLVTEFRPTPGNLFGLLLIGGVVVMRQLTGLRTRPLTSSPAFWLTVVGWVLGYKATRFWEDWGAPACMVMLAIEVQSLLEARLPADSLKRLGLAAGLGATAFLATTNDVDSRWTFNVGTAYVTQENPELSGRLPGPGGIWYDVDMFFFYQTFFKNPHADWKYMVGFEPAMMPHDDFITYQNILLSGGDPRAYRPWVAKLRPQDRLAIRSSGPAPDIPQLEWTRALGLWIGRVRPTSP